jgi:hypothetical protein
MPISGFSRGILKDSIVFFLSPRDATISPKAEVAAIPNFPYNLEIRELSLDLTSAPSGSSLITTINLNGTLVLKVTVGEGETSSGSIAYTISVPKGSYLSVGIEQVGSTETGTNPVLYLNGVR